jgi:hypothetical protein
MILMINLQYVSAHVLFFTLQLMQNANQASSIALSMLQDFDKPPAGGIQALRTQLTAKAQQVLS